MSQKISVLLIAQNSEKQIKRCLDSLVRFDEVVFVDGGSEDKTIEIAKSYSNVVVFENPWPGFIEQRNFSLTKATHDWCFMIDADEKVEADAVEEIYKIVNSNPKEVMFKIMRTEFYLGQKLENGYGSSDWQERLFVKNRVSYYGGVHHKHYIDGKPLRKSSHLVGEINPKLRVLHDQTYGLDAWIKKLPRFAFTVADEKISKGRSTNAFVVLVSFIGTFIQIFLKSFKLGRVGFVIAVQTALYRCLVKLLIYENSNIGFDKRRDIGENLG